MAFFNTFEAKLFLVTRYIFPRSRTRATPHARSSSLHWTDRTLSQCYEQCASLKIDFEVFVIYKIIFRFSQPFHHGFCFFKITAAVGVDTHGIR